VEIYTGESLVNENLRDNSSKTARPSKRQRAANLISIILDPSADTSPKGKKIKIVEGPNMDAVFKQSAKWFYRSKYGGMDFKQAKMA